MLSSRHASDSRTFNSNNKHILKLVLGNFFHPPVFSGGNRTSKALHTPGEGAAGVFEHRQHEYGHEAKAMPREHGHEANAMSREHGRHDGSRCASEHSRHDGSGCVSERALYDESARDHDDHP